MAHRIQGNTCTSLLKDIINDTDEHPDEEIFRGMYLHVFSNLEVLQAPYIGDLYRDYHTVMTDY